MPTDDRVRSAIVEISERIGQIGYNTHDVIGPVDIESGENIEDSLDEESEQEGRYYLTGTTDDVAFYIMFGTDIPYAAAVYPMNILKHLGTYLEENEVEEILGKSIGFKNIGSEEKNQLHTDAAGKIIENTEPAKFHKAAFNVSAYASTALVKYHQITTDNGFPIDFQCVRGIFPYDEQMSKSRLDDRILPVIIAGERGRRYVEYSFRVEKEDRKPPEYEFRAIL